MRHSSLTPHRAETSTYKTFEHYLKAAYGKQARQYRLDDEIEVTTEHHRHLRGVLESLSASFDRPIRVLDAGCGTGRYFHCIRNAEELIGIDLCPEMLQAAHWPVQAERISARKISLVCANIFNISPPARPFDLIYSIGMFALGCPLSVSILRDFHEWLAPDGRLFFNVADRDGISRWKLLRRWLRTRVYRIAPTSIRNKLDARAGHLENCPLTRSELHTLMGQSPFDRCRIISRPCKSPLWSGRHLECVAWKHDLPRAIPISGAPHCQPFFRSLPRGF